MYTGFWSSRINSYGFTNQTHLTLDSGSKQDGMAGKQFLTQYFRHQRLPDSPGRAGTTPKRKWPKNPNFDINQKKRIPYCNTPCNWLRLHWNLQNVIYGNVMGSLTGPRDQYRQAVFMVFTV